MAGEGLHILAEATPVDRDVQVEAQPVLRTLQVFVDAGGSQRVSTKMAHSGTRSKAPWLAMSAMTEDWTPSPRQMKMRVGGESIIRPPRRRPPAQS